MKRMVMWLAFLVMSGCVSLQTPQETKIAVSTLLDEIQVAINTINERTKETSLPPFKSAELTLSTKAEKTKSGEASLVLSGKRSNVTTDSNIITLELVPNPERRTPKIGQRDKCCLGSRRHPDGLLVIHTVRCPPVKRLMPAFGVVEREIPA